MATPNINSISGNISVSDNGTTKSGGTTRGGGVRASNNAWGPLPAFNPIVELLRELWRNYQGVKIETTEFARF
jgi:hypothetical protein